MAIIKNEFILAINQIASERGIAPEDVISSIEAAVLAAFKKERPDMYDSSVTAKIDVNTGEVKIYKDGKNITPEGFGRIAAQTAKQVIIQKIREAEKKRMIDFYKDQVGEILKGRVIRTDGRNVYMDLGKAEGILPYEEQIKGEKYPLNQTFTVLLKEIKKDKYGHMRIFLSRRDEGLLLGLLKREVPEIEAGTVEVKAVVREPGERAKVAVYSNSTIIDPVGTCVGQKGVRVQTITQELGGNEKVDIIQWHSDPKVFIAAALSPAKIEKIEVDEKEKRAKVYVDEEQAALAIGQKGVNVNLASKLTGYEIDIIQIEKPKESASQEKKEEKTEEK